MQHVKEDHLYILSRRTHVRFLKQDCTKSLSQIFLKNVSVVHDSFLLPSYSTANLKYLKPWRTTTVQYNISNSKLDSEIKFHW